MPGLAEGVFAGSKDITLLFPGASTVPFNRSACNGQVSVRGRGIHATLFRARPAGKIVRVIGGKSAGQGIKCGNAGGDDCSKSV